MTATAEPADAEDAAYFRAIEDAFVRLRGAPLLLSPTDFQVASRWRRDGVPLPLVLATLEEVFTRRRERGARGRINSLRYCAPAVEEAWGEIVELQGPPRRRGDAEEELDVATKLEALAGALRERLPAVLPDPAACEAMLERLAAVAATPADEAEMALRRFEEELLGAAERSLDDAARERLAGEVEAIVDGLRDRFPDEELVLLRGQLRRQRLRRLLELPVLTLF